MLRATLLCVFVALAAAACSDRQADPEGANDERAASEPSSASDPSQRVVASPSVRPGVPLDRLLSPRDNDGAVVAGLRSPREQRAEAEPNRHVQGQVDTVRTYVYDGMVIETYEVTGGPTFIQRVTATGTGYGTASGVAVGALRSDVEAALGPPVQEDAGVVVYETGDRATPTTVTVRYEPDERGRPRAFEITWRPYLD